MADGKLFKTAFSGFDKKDVIQYITELDEELAAVKEDSAAQIEKLKAELEEKEEIINEKEYNLQSALSKLEASMQEIKQLNNVIVRLQEEIDNYGSSRKQIEEKIEENNNLYNSLRQRNQELFEALKSKDSEIYELKERIKELSSRQADNKPVFAAGESLPYENLVADAMEQAGKIIANAKKKANEIISDSKISAVSARKKLEEIGKQIECANESVSDSMSCITEIFNSLIASLKEVVADEDEALE